MSELVLSPRPDCSGRFMPVGKFKVQPVPGGLKPSVYSIRWSSDGKLLAAALDDGRIRIYNGRTGKTISSIIQDSIHPNASNDDHRSHHPPHSVYHNAKDDLAMAGISAATVALRFSPHKREAPHHYTILSATSDGLLRHWKVSSHHRHDDINHTLESEIDLGMDASAMAIDYNKKGTLFAAGCKDHVVRIFDEETRRCIHTLDGGEGRHHFPGYFDLDPTHPHYAIHKIQEEQAFEYAQNLNAQRSAYTVRHDNRLYSVKFACSWGSFMDNLVLSAGWDTSMQLWDLRTSGPPVKTYSDVHVAGDSVDVCDCKILAASFHSSSTGEGHMTLPASQLQIFDVRGGSGPLPTPSLNDDKTHCYYTAQFSSNRDIGFNPDPEGLQTCFIAAGGTGSNKVKIFDHKRNNELACVIDDLPGGVVSLDFCPRIFKDDWDVSDKGARDTTALADLDDQGEGNAVAEPVPMEGEMRGYDHLKVEHHAGEAHVHFNQHFRRTRLALACKDGSIRVVDICPVDEQGYARWDEEEVVDGEEDEEYVRPEPEKKLMQESAELVDDGVQPAGAEPPILEQQTESMVVEPTDSPDASQAAIERPHRSYKIIKYQQVWDAATGHASTVVGTVRVVGSKSGKPAAAKKKKPQREPRQVITDPKELAAIKVQSQARKRQAHVRVSLLLGKGDPRRQGTHAIDVLSGYSADPQFTRGQALASLAALSEPAETKDASP